MTHRSIAFAFALALLAACGTSETQPRDEARTAGGASALERTPVSRAEPMPIRPLQRQFIRYEQFRNALEEVLLKRDGSYLVVLGTQTFGGTWGYDSTAMTITLTPAEGQPAPPEASFDIVREDCDPVGWIPTLLENGAKLIPYDIDPEFERLHCAPPPVR